MSNPYTHSIPLWRDIHQMSAHHLPARWRSWLADEGSLTRRLIDISDGDFSVTVLNQQLRRPRLDEARLLGTSPTARALVREVILFGRGEALVYARSVIPRTTLTGRLKSLAQLDNRPLGAVLFADSSMTRSTIQVAQIPGNELPPSLTCDDDLLWGRRSVFFLDRKPLLVSEIFLPAFKP